VSVGKRGSLQKRNRSQTITRTKPFHIEADKANNALELEKVEVDNKALKSSYNIKKQADKLYGSISWFMDDFMTRLEASVVAGKQGTDELNAFKRGFKKEGDDDLNEE
jgi:hypothetical protein